MRKQLIRSAAWILLGSLPGCSGQDVEEAPSVPAVSLRDLADPLATEPPVVPWRPPRQMAAFVHPHEDPTQGALIGGHWMVVLLGQGGWYFKDDPDREPLPDREASPEELRKAARGLEVPAEAAIPFRRGDPPKP
jgi:hypothetical protein